MPEPLARLPITRCSSDAKPSTPKYEKVQILPEEPLSPLSAREELKEPEIKLEAELNLID